MEMARGVVLFCSGGSEASEEARVSVGVAGTVTATEEEDVDDARRLTALTVCNSCKNGAIPVPVEIVVTLSTAWRSIAVVGIGPRSSIVSPSSRE